MKIRTIAAILCLCAVLGLAPGVTASQAPAGITAAVPNAGDDVPQNDFPESLTAQDTEDALQVQLEEYLRAQERLEQLVAEQKVRANKIIVFSITAAVSLLGLILTLVLKRKYEKNEK